MKILKKKLTFVFSGCAILMATNSIVFAEDCDTCYTDYFNSMVKCEKTWDNSNMDIQAQEEANSCVNYAANVLQRCQHKHNCKQ